MIIDSFDVNSNAIISPAAFFGEKNKICDIAIATFSREIYPAVLECFPNELIGELKAANRIKPLHLLTAGNQKIVFYLSEIGATLSGTDIVEINWTTDALYRETRNLVETRKSEGCIAVEMELAGMQAVCDFYNIELYDFFVTGDVVDQMDYTSDGLHEANHNLDKFYIALKLAEIING